MSSFCGCHIAFKALSAARHLPRNTVRNASLARSRKRQWDKLLISYDVNYGDYGGRANVAFYVTEVEGKPIVLVFDVCRPEQQHFCRPADS